MGVRRLQLETAGKMLIILDSGIIGNLDSNSPEQSSMTVVVCVPEQASSRRAEFLLLLTWFQALQVSPPVTFPLNRTVWLSGLRSASASLRGLQIGRAV